MESKIATASDVIKDLQKEYGGTGRIVSYAALGIPIPKSYTRCVQFSDDVFSANNVPFARMFKEYEEISSVILLRSACPYSGVGYKQGEVLWCLKKLGIPVLRLFISPSLAYPFPQLSEYNIGGNNMYMSVFDKSKDYVASVKNLYTLNLIQFLRMYKYNDWSRHERSFWYRKYEYDHCDASHDDWANIKPKDILYEITLNCNHKNLQATGITCPYDIAPAVDAIDQIRQGKFPPRRNRLTPLLAHYGEYLEDISYGVEAPPCNNDLVKQLLLNK